MGWLRCELTHCSNLRGRFEFKILFAEKKQRSTTPSLTGPSSPTHFREGWLLTAEAINRSEISVLWHNIRYPWLFCRITPRYDEIVGCRPGSLIYMIWWCITCNQAIVEGIYEYENVCQAIYAWLYVHGFCFLNNGLNMLPWTSFTCYTKDNQQGCFRLSNWFSLRRLGPWMNHLPPAW